jgi:hypothetical protein
VVLKRNRIGLARKDIALNEKNALAAELEDFIAAVKASQAAGSVVPAKVPGEAGLRALKLATAIEKEVRDYNERYGFKFRTPPAVEDC